MDAIKKRVMDMEKGRVLAIEDGTAESPANSDGQDSSGKRADKAHGSQGCASDTSSSGRPHAISPADTDAIDAIVEMRLAMSQGRDASKEAKAQAKVASGDGDAEAPCNKRQRIADAASAGDGTRPIHRKPILKRPAASLAEPRATSKYAKIDVTPAMAKTYPAMPADESPI